MQKVSSGITEFVGTRWVRNVMNAIGASRVLKLKFSDSYSGSYFESAMILTLIDAVVLATGNDFRAVEAGIHAYAARSGKYRSLSSARIENGHFYFSLDIPIAIGTVGGLTQLHPLVKWSLALLGNPKATELMQIIAVAGLAQNFAALRSLVTSGIQKGHMKMHLLNILNQLEANTTQKEAAVNYFKTNTVSFSAVADFLKTTA